MQRLLLALALMIAVVGSRQAAATARFLEFVDEVPIPRIFNPKATVMSPDGAYVYVAAEDAVTIYSRDAGTGALTFAGLGFTGVDFNRLTTLVLSPGGAHLYVIGERALVVFGRNAGTGALTLIQAKLSSGPDAVPSLLNATDIAISPDGAHIYVVTPSNGAILRFGRNATTGEVTFEEVMLDSPSTSFGGPVALGISGDGAFVYVASVFDDVVAIFSRNAGTGALTFVDSESVLNPDLIALSPDGANAYVGSTFELTVYGRDAGTGALTLQQTHHDGVGDITLMSVVNDILVTADGAHVYVTAGGDDALLVFGRDAGNGNLTLLAENQNGVGGIIGLSDAYSVAVSPGDAHLYVTANLGFNLGGGIAVFARNAGTGAVTQTQYLTPRVSPSAIALSPDAAHLYAAGRDKVSTYTRDPGTGALNHASDVTDGFGGIDGVGGANTVAVSPDGAHVYATGEGDDALAVFARNATTGALTPVEVERDGVGGVNLLNAPQDLVISGDGLYVYVSADGDDAVSVFARDPGTGVLTPTAGGATGLPNAHDLTLAPDGAYLYVSSSSPSAVSTFSRDAVSGALTLVGTLVPPPSVGGTSVSPDGAHLYVRLFNSRELLQVYSRDAGGVLTLASEIKDNEPGLSVGNGQLFFSADGGTGFMGGAIFSRNPANGSLGFVDRPTPVPGTSGAYALGPNGEVYTSSGRSVQRYAPGYAGCEASPLPVCHGAGGGTLRLGFRAPSITLSWISAATLMPSDFGSPDLTDHYALCFYDESGPLPVLILGALAPAGQQCATARDCWTPRATGFVYRDRVRTPEGISALTLKAGTPARIRVVAGKGHVDFPGLPLPVPIRVQVQTSGGACFEATYSDPSSNSSQAFLARPD